MRQASARLDEAGRSTSSSARASSARPCHLPAGALCRESLRLLLDLVGGRTSDSRLAVGVPHLPEKRCWRSPPAAKCEAAASLSRARFSSLRRMTVTRRWPSRFPGANPPGARRSHYRSVVDTARIIVMVGRKPAPPRACFRGGCFAACSGPRCWWHRSARCSTGKADPGLHLPELARHCGGSARGVLRFGARRLPPRGKQKSEFAYTRLSTNWHVCCIAAGTRRG